MAVKMEKSEHLEKHLFQLSQQKCYKRLGRVH